MTKATKAEQDEALERLRGWVKPGDTVWCVLRHRSASGMYRAIDFYTITPDRERAEGVSIGWLSYNIAKALGMRFDEKHEAVGVSGAGMDMGFHVVYTLAYTLWPDGFRCTGKNCPSNEHSNSPYPKPNGRMKHHSAGYALNHKWLG